MSLSVPVSKEEAIVALRAAAWAERHEKVYEPVIVLNGEQLYRDVTPQERRVVHAYAGGIGADWPLQVALRTAENSSRCFWSAQSLTHHLNVVSAGHNISFEVEAPLEVRAMWQREAMKLTQRGQS